MTSSQRARSVQSVPGVFCRGPQLRPLYEIQDQNHADQEQQTVMEAITFSKDTVLSDIHLRIHHKRQLMVRLNTVGQPVFQTQFKILWGNNALEAASNKEENSIGDENEALPSRETVLHDVQELEALLDEDGDLEVQRRPPTPSDKPESPACIRNVVCPTILTIGSEENYAEEASCNPEDVVKIEHTMATPLEDVGKQIWRGAFLLADYILWQQDLFRGCTALDLGAGTGFTSVIMATVAKTVYCTDVGEDLLDMCERNISLNKGLTKTGGQVKVKELDWLKNQLCRDLETLYSWTEDDIADLYDQTTVILAADVFYDDDLTDALFKTLYRITYALTRLCTIYLSIERRFNFTLRYMDITCDAYNHFRNCLNNFVKINNGKLKWTATEIKPVFPQFFSYEREHLELWKLAATTLT